MTAGILLQSLISGSWTSVRALRPLAAPLPRLYGRDGGADSPHLSLSVVVQTGQRFQLFLFPLVVGAFAALTGRITPMLQAYVVSATLLAVASPLDLLAGQRRTRSAS